MSTLKAGDAFHDFVGPLGNPSEFIHEDVEELKKKKYLFVAGGVGRYCTGISTGKMDA